MKNLKEAFTPQDITKLQSLLHNNWANAKTCTWVRLVDTQSMSPALSGNAFLLVEWTIVHNLQKGDLIVFKPESQNLLVVHRVCIIESNENGDKILQIADQIKDAGEIIGSWIVPENVYGKVMAIRWGKSNTKIAPLSSGPIRMLGYFIAKLSVIRWRQFQKFKKDYSGKNYLHRGLRTAINMLHWLVCYIYAFVLRIAVVIPHGQL